MTQPEQNSGQDETQGQGTPYGQSSPYGQNSAEGQSSPYGQSSTEGQGAPYGQNSAEGQGAPYGQDAGTSAQSAPYGPGSPTYGQQPPTDTSWAPARAQQSEAGFFRAMVDFKFDHFITVKFSSFLYIVAFLVAALLWLGQILVAILFGSMIAGFNSVYGEASFNAVPLILAIVFGWIPSVIALIAMRLGLEFSVATVRTAQNTTTIAESATAGR